MRGGSRPGELLWHAENLSQARFRYVVEPVLSQGTIDLSSAAEHGEKPTIEVGVLSELTLQVLDGATGEPVPDAELSWCAGEASAFDGPRVWCEIPLDAAGNSGPQLVDGSRLSLRLRAPGYTEDHVEIDTSERHGSLTLRLTRE